MDPQPLALLSAMPLQRLAHRFGLTDQYQTQRRVTRQRRQRSGSHHVGAMIATHGVQADSNRLSHAPGPWLKKPPAEPGWRAGFLHPCVSVLAPLHDLSAPVVAVRADMVATVGLARLRFHRQGRAGQGVVGTAHAALEGVLRFC